MARPENTYGNQRNQQGCPDFEPDRPPPHLPLLAARATQSIDVDACKADHDVEGCKRRRAKLVNMVKLTPFLLYLRGN